MRVFVATSRSQGRRETDVDACLDGELVWIEATCEPARHRGVDTCARCRHFTGVVTGGRTTTAEVRDLAAMTAEHYREALRTGLAATGRPAGWADEMAGALLAFAAQWGDGAVIERDRDSYRERQVAPGPRGR